jgi:hypothetical protein
VNPRKNPIVQEYVLPDFSTNRRGCIRKGPNGSKTHAEKPSADEPVYSTHSRNARFGNEPQVTFRHSNWDRGHRGIQTISKSDIDLALAEERCGDRISNRHISDFIKTAVIARSAVVGLNTSRARFRAEIWGALVSSMVPLPCF